MYLSLLKRYEILCLILAYSYLCSRKGDTINSEITFNILKSTKLL